MFAEVLAQDGPVRRICFMYSKPEAPYADLYQEVMANLWRGLDKFRGEAKLSTWVYRTAINTCISYLRLNSRHGGHSSLDEAAHLVAGDDSERADQLSAMYRLINELDAVEKAVIMLWLDENSYEQIAEVTGLSPANVAVKLHRIRTKLKKKAQNEQF